MSVIYTNTGLKLYMESAVVADATVTAMSLAAPGVFTLATHGFLAGDVLRFTTNVSQLDGRLMVVAASPPAGTFSLLDIAGGATAISTIGFDAMTTMTVAKVTLGTAITGCKDFSAKGGEPKMLDSTTVHDKRDRQIVAGVSASTYDMVMNWDPADAGQTAMINAFTTGSAKGFKVLYPNGRYVLFSGTVGYGGAPGGGSQAITTSPAAIALSGPPTYAI